MRRADGPPRCAPVNTYPETDRKPVASMLGNGRYADVRPAMETGRPPPDRPSPTPPAVSTTRRGDFTRAHPRAGNSHVRRADARKNTVDAFARDGVGEIEQFGLRPARHFAGVYE